MQARQRGKQRCAIKAAQATQARQFAKAIDVCNLLPKVCKQTRRQGPPYNSLVWVQATAIATHESLQRAAPLAPANRYHLPASQSNHKERMDEYPAAHGSFAKTPCISAEPRYSGAIRPSVELQRGGLGTRTWQLRLTPMRLSGQPSEPNVVWINWPRLACLSRILTRSKATGGRVQ